MANNQLTDEELQTLIIELQQTAYRLNGTNSAYLMSDAIKPLRELQERRKAAMDSEPVGYFGRFDPDDEDLIDQCSKNVKGAFPLYRHAQQPLVPDDVLDALQKVARIRLDLNDFDGDRRGIADCLGDAEEALIEVVNRRAAILQASPACTCPSGDGSLRWSCPVHPGKSPVIPEGYVMVPMSLTAENGAKSVLSGEFSETKFINCPECFGDDECETCDGSGRVEIKVPVSWTTIKAIWVKGVEHFATTITEE